MNIWIVIIFIIYVVMLFINPHKAFIIYAIIKPLINKNFALISSPGLPLLSLDMAICIVTLTFYLIFRRKCILLFQSFPLKRAFYFYLSAILLSTLFSTIGYSQSIVRSIAFINNDWLFVILLWMIITEKKDLIILFRSYLVIYFIMAIYGLIEKALGYNPFMEYESSLIQDSSKIISFFYKSDDRLGMGRIQSFTTHAITYGGLLTILLVSYYYLYFNYNKWKKSIAVVMSISFLFLSNIIYTNSRSPLLFLFLAFIGLWNKKNIEILRFFFKGGLVLAVVLIVFNHYFSVYYENIVSILFPESSSVGGSDVIMRISQFNIAFDLFSSNPVFGLGIGSLSDILFENIGLIGAESVWLPIIIEQGLWGICCFVVFIIDLYKGFRLKDVVEVNKYFIFMISGWLVYATVTGEMGTRIFILSILIIIYRLSSPERIIEDAST